jgi:membrane protease subunit (stomatin/prohibitin family)
VGLLKAGFGALSGVLADSWRDYFYCEALDEEVLVRKGAKRASKRSSNTKGEENIISNGSIIAVNEGQCMIIVEQGKVVDVCADAGEFVYDSETEPSIFTGPLGKSVKDSFRELGKRFTFGGGAAMDQRVYFFNTKELMGNKYGTANPVPFRVVDRNIGLDIDIAIRCFGEYSYHIDNPILFYTNVCGNVSGDYRRSELDDQLKSEMMTALQPAFAKISELGIRYSSLPGHTMELAQALNEVLSRKWSELRGISIVSLGISSIKAPEEDEAMIKELQRNAALRDPSMAAAHLTGAQAAAMQSAAKNEGGAMGAFIGMGMAQSAGGANAQSLYGMAAERATPRPAENGGGGGWVCPKCGKPDNTGAFCPKCGNARPAESAPSTDEGSWFCPKCGNPGNTGAFCPKCGEKRPEGI